jgi:hypothetical protein
MRFPVGGLVLLLLLVGTASAELVAVSQLGYHPQSSKQAISFTSVSSGTFSVKDTSGATVFSGTLRKARDYDNTMNVECQGNNPCLVADFSAFTTPGTYTVQTSIGGTSPSFTINSNVFTNNAPIFLEFFNAQLQQKSAYHGDIHAGYSPAFPAIADGSFLMEADQAALTAIRLGSAYRRNPQLFQTDKYTMLASGKPDLQEHLKVYTDYLMSLQGVTIQQRTDGTGFRISPFVSIAGAFTPGAVTQSSVTVYDGGHNPVASYPVKSLCGANDGSTRYNTCVSNAANFYKCSVGEICLNLTYTEKTGVLTGNTGYAVSQGWSYEFGCFEDIPLSGVYNGQMDPCLVFKDATSQSYTVMTLLAYLEALPAVNAYSPAAGQALFDRAYNTQTFIKNNYVLSGSDNNGYYGAALFLLYDYTGDQQFLRDAYNVRSKVDTTFVGDKTHGNEYYWEEYVRHKAQITALGLAYQYTAEDPENFFRGKIFNDYKDQGGRSISRNAERVFIFDNNIQFSNSRFMLTEGLLAAKATELFPGAESFIPLVADNQLAWLTGMNGVQAGTSTAGSPIASYSFIFGIGNFPSQFHSRYLLDTGYRSASGGAVVGGRSIDFYYPSGSNWNQFDGVATVLGQQLGSMTGVTPLKAKTFTNGKTYIPGWINGAFDVTYDNDVIFNYQDDRNLWEMTEATNEQVATAMELFAYLDARYNNRPRASTPTFTPGNVCTPGTETCNTVDDDCDGLVDEGGVCGSSCTPTTEVCDGVDNNCNGQADENNVCAGNTCYTSVKTIPATCTGGSFVTDTWNGCRVLKCASGADSLQIQACDKTGYFEIYKQSKVGSAVSDICIGATCIGNNGYAKSGNFPICTGTSTCTPATEVCDSKDNDCDGQVDEGNVCGSTCTPVTETCNSKDDDCDGQIDEGNVCTANTCYNSVKDVPVSCSAGSVTQDTWNGCRLVTCTANTGSLQVQACDKTGFFEIYRKTATGVAPKVCLATACMQSEGYVKSSTFPICTGSTPTCTPTTEVCDQKDNDCDGQIDENACATPAQSVTVSVAQWYPKGRQYLFNCNAQGFTPTKYGWDFGDGTIYPQANQNQYYTYSNAGSYTVKCTASSATQTVSGTLFVQVA